jgi:hypothetical protein
MKLRLRFRAGDLRSVLREAGYELAESATEAAAFTLQNELARTGAPDVVLDRAGGRRRLSTHDAAAILRETGSLGHDPDPWLAPSLPPARGAMREAARVAVSRTLALFRNKRR